MKLDRNCQTQHKLYGGDSGMIIESYQSGNAKIEIDDAAIVQTQAEIDWILARAAEIVREG